MRLMRVAIEWLRGRIPHLGQTHVALGDGLSDLLPWRAPGRHRAARALGIGSQGPLLRGRSRRHRSCNLCWPWYRCRGTFPFTAADSTYGEDGIYVVTLRVEDDEGVFVEVETTVTTTNSPPVVTVTTTNSPPVLTVAPPASLTVDEGILVTLTATATDAGSDEDCSARVLQKTRTLSAHSVHSVISSRELRRVPSTRSASRRPRASMHVPHTPTVAPRFARASASARRCSSRAARSAPPSRTRRRPRPRRRASPSWGPSSGGSARAAVRCTPAPCRRAGHSR